MSRGSPAGLAFLLLPLTCATACDGGGTVAPPNIVLLVADDQDYEHLGFLGNPRAHTPTLDRLAAEGTVFPVAHASSARCRPALASLLTGRWPHQHGIFFNEGEGTLDPTGALPALLREAGYATFLGGKFWEGDPERMGFEASDVDDGFAREGQQALFTFIRENAGQRPLFLWWAPMLPHFPYDPPRPFVDLLELQDVPTPEWFEREEWAGVDALEARFLEHSVLATVAWFDDCIRQLRDELEANGLLENTLFCYLIDNGSANGLVSKGSPFEKGVRTPLIFSWPGEVPAGVTRPQLASVLDVHATLLEFAGVELPRDCEGHGLRAVIAGDPDPAARDALFGAAYPRQARGRKAERNAYALYARTDTWKYVLYLERIDAEKNDLYRIKHSFAPPLLRRRGDEDLFRLANDPYELEDLSGRPEHRALCEELRARVLTWWSATGGGELRLP